MLPNSIEDSGGVSTEGLQPPAFELTVSADKEGEAPKSCVVVVDAAESTSNVLEHGETESYSQLLSGESETVPSVIGGDRETSQSNQLFPHRDVAELGFTEESRSNASKCANELLSNGPPNIISPGKGPATVSQANDLEDDNKVQQLCSETIVSDSVDTGVEIQKLKMEMKMKESALQGAARQALVFHSLDVSSY